VLHQKKVTKVAAKVEKLEIQKAIKASSNQITKTAKSNTLKQEFS